MKNLEIKWTISKARETAGYNVVTLRDWDKKYKASGGGYDMLGTVFAQWLWANYKLKIVVACGDRREEFYGLNKVEDRYWIDGGCGLECMLKIAKEIGLKVTRLYTRKGETTNFIVE